MKSLSQNTDDRAGSAGMPAALLVRPYVLPDDSRTYYRLVDEQGVVFAEGVPDLETARMMGCARRLASHMEYMLAPCRSMLCDVMLDLPAWEYSPADVVAGDGPVDVDEDSTEYHLALVLEDADGVLSYLRG